MDRFFIRLAGVAQKHAWPIIAATAVITVVLGWFALQIKVDPSITNLIPQDQRLTRLAAKYGQQNATTDYLIIFAEAPDLVSRGKLARLADAYKRIEAIRTVSPGITPFNFITFEKEDGRLRFAAMADGQRPPQTDEELDRFSRRITHDPVARNLVISADGSTLCALFPVLLQDDYSRVLGQAEAIIGPLKGDMDIRIAGILPYNRAVLSHLSRDLPILLGLALVVILISYYISFRSKRATLLPVLVVILGTVWTVGVMQIAGFKLTIVQVMTPPLVLILGSAYSIHILNQYYREARVGGGDKRWIVDSVGHITTTVFLASSTTVFGFASLLTSSLRQLREFGVATSVGIVFCALLSLIFLPSALSLLTPPTAGERDRALEGFITRNMGYLARTITRWRALVLVAAGLILVGFVFSLWAVRYETDFTRYFRNKESAVDDNQRLVEKIGGFVTLNFSLSAPGDAPNYFLDPEVLTQVSRFEDTLARDKDVAYTSSFAGYLRHMNEVMTGSSEVPSTRPLILLLSRYFAALSSTPLGANLTSILMNRNFSRYTLVLRVYDSANNNIPFEGHTREIIDRIQDYARQTLPASITGEFWGPTISTLYLSETLTRNQISSIISSALLVFLISALVFRSFKLGILVLAPLASGIMLNFIIMWIFSIPLDVLTITFSSIAIGIGVDNAIHLTIQYRRQRKIYPMDPEKTIEHTMKVAGRPMILTTAAIMAALLLFLFSSFRPVEYFGLLISISLGMTTAGALVFLPVLLYFDARGKARKALAEAALTPPAV